jgi:hypothetical protein
LAKQEERDCGRKRAPVQPPRGGEVKRLRAACNFKNDGAKGADAGGFLGNP